MKKRTITACILVLFAILYGIQFWRVNKDYPAPKNVEVNLNGSIQIEGLEIILLRAELLDERQIHQKINSLTETESSDRYSDNTMRLYLMTVSCKNVLSEKNNADFTQWMIESGAWGNGINGELFKILNEDISIIQELEAQEEITVQLPFTMVESMFTKKQWRGINDRTFSVVLSLYPEKIMLKGE